MSAFMENVKYRETLMVKPTLTYDDLEWLLSYPGQPIGKQLFTEHQFFNLGNHIYTSQEILNMIHGEIHPDSNFVFDKTDGHHISDDFWFRIPARQ